jgi:hypothetical protein
MQIFSLSLEAATRLNRAVRATAFPRIASRASRMRSALPLSSMTGFAEWQDCQVYGGNCQLACPTRITSAKLRDGSETLSIFFRSHANPITK